MPISDHIAHTKGGSNQGMPCSVATLLATLPPSEADELRHLVNAPWRVVSHSALERAIREEGHVVGVGAIGKHRRGDCRCAK